MDSNKKIILVIAVLTIILTINLILFHKNENDYIRTQPRSLVDKKVKVKDKEWSEAIDRRIENKTTLFVVGPEWLERNTRIKVYDCGGGVYGGQTEWTDDLAMLNTSNGEVFFGPDMSLLWRNPYYHKFQNVKSLTNISGVPIIEMPPKAIRVYYQYEPPLGVYSLCDRSPYCIGLFQWSIGWHPKSRVQIKAFDVTSLYSLEQVDFDYSKQVLPFKSKDKIVTWVAKACLDENEEFTSSRTKFVEDLMKYIRVDSYGKCLKNIEFDMEPGQANSDGISTKLETIKKYKFYLSLENSNCPYYMSEKPFQCLVRGVVPIVSAHPTALLFLPKGSFINLADFETNQQLADYLVYLNDNDQEYQKFFEFRKDLPYIRDWIDSFPRTRGITTPCELHRQYLRYQETNYDLQSPPYLKPSDQDVDCFMPFDRFLK